MIKNCPQCGRVYVHNENDMCLDCDERLRRLYEQVRTYLRHHPGANTMSVVKDTGIPLATIRHLIQRKSLGMQLKGYSCSRCGGQGACSCARD